MKKAIVLCAAIAGFAPMQERPERDPLLDRFIGSWQGEGTGMGMQTMEHMRWEWTLGDHFVRVTAQAMGTAEDGAAMNHEAHAYIRVAEEGRYVGTVFDNFGTMARIEGAATDGGMTFEWGEGAAEPGRVVYRFTDDTTLEAIYLGRENGEWVEHARATLRR